MAKIIRVSQKFDGDRFFIWQENYGKQYIRTTVYIDYWWKLHPVPVFTYVKIQRKRPIYGMPHITSGNDKHIQEAIRNRPIEGYEYDYVVCQLDRWIDGARYEVPITELVTGKRIAPRKKIFNPKTK